MKKTFKELLEIDMAVANMYKNNPELKDSKFGYAWKRFYDKNIQKVLNDYRDAIVDCRVKHALEKDGRIVTDNESNRGYGYSKQGLIECIKEEKLIENEYNDKEIEVTPHIVPESAFPQVITEYEKELLTGLVL